MFTNETNPTDQPAQTIIEEAKKLVDGEMEFTLQIEASIPYALTLSREVIQYDTEAIK